MSIFSEQRALRAGTVSEALDALDAARVRGDRSQIDRVLSKIAQRDRQLHAAICEALTEVLSYQMMSLLLYQDCDETLARWYQALAVEEKTALADVACVSWSSEDLCKFSRHLTTEEKISWAAKNGVRSPGAVARWLGTVDIGELNGAQLRELMDMAPLRYAVAAGADVAWRLAAELTESQINAGAGGAVGATVVEAAAVALFDPQLANTLKHIIYVIDNLGGGAHISMSRSASRAWQLLTVGGAEQGIPTSAGQLIAQLTDFIPTANLTGHLGSLSGEQAAEMLTALERVPSDRQRAPLRKEMIRRLNPDAIAICLTSWHISISELDGGQETQALLRVPMPAVSVLAKSASLTALVDQISDMLDGDLTEFWALTDTWNGSPSQLVDSILGARS